MTRARVARGVAIIDCAIYRRNETAAKAYARGRKGSYDLMSADF
jgi:hypothetical protein